MVTLPLKQVRVFIVNTSDFELVSNQQQALGFTLHSWHLANGDLTVIAVYTKLREIRDTLE